MPSSPGSRICGMLTAKGRILEWEKALEHIAEHFHSAPHKPTHTVFRKKFRDADTLKEYVKRAVTHPSAIRPGILTIAGLPIGSPCTYIIREFNEPLGLDDREVCLFIVVDDNQVLITAYPKTKIDAEIG